MTKRILMFAFAVVLALAVLPGASAPDHRSKFDRFRWQCSRVLL
jgi:hypothetical protein